jgi:signal transduction histidine kinase
MKRRHSLRSQIAALFIGLLLISVLSIVVINGLFLETYYISKKADSLKEAVTYLEQLKTDTAADSDDETEEILEDDDIPDDIRDISSRYNLSWIIITNDNQILAHVGDNMNMLRDRLFGYAYNLDDEETQGTVIEQEDDHILQQVHDRFLETDYVEIWGTLSNGNYYLIRTPMASIRESAEISNTFFFIVGIVILIISGCVIWVLTKKITKPISELTQLSQQMEKLDFDAVYKSHANNEIDVLGENFNHMCKRLEQTISELKSANNALEKDIADKIKIDQMRKEFLDNVSHELKTPIALIQGYAEGLKENISDDQESREFYCDVIMDESQKMNKLVKNLLTLNQLESGKDAVVMERFDIVSLIRGVIASMDIMIQQKEATLLFQEENPIYVWADEFKTEEVVTNYLSNALNHLDGERQIEIRIYKTEERVRVSVFNTGNPIPEEDIPKLWNKFYKVDKARTREYGGSGIGLSIVKAIMEGMNQEYGVENYDNGVAFYFTLDCK